MPDKHHVAIDRARKAAKLLSREGGITHQQALDQIARNAGFQHWNAMASAKPVTETPAPLLLTGPDAAPLPTALRRGPAKLFFELDEFRYLPPPNPSTPTLQAVEAETREPMAATPRRPGLALSEWVLRTMRDAAAGAAHKGAERHGHRIRELPFDATMAAQALDPAGAPHEGDDLLVRCPLHDDATPSLRIIGSGSGLRMACMAGCSHSDLQDRLISRLGEASHATLAFMRDNDRSKVVEGYGNGRPGVGGAGGTYRLENGTTHRLEVLSCRMLPDGYPDWYDGKVPRSVKALERRLRIAIAGRFPIVVEAPEDRARGLWRFTVKAGHDGRYLVLLSMRQGEQAGVNAGHSGRFSVTAAETFDTAARAVERAIALTRSLETIDPAERTADEVRHAREVARDVRLRGTVNGWGWWAGPNPDEMTYGGPYKTRAEAISNGNGSCDEEGEHFYVLQARADEEGLDEDGMVVFAETRGLKRCRCV